MGGERRPAPPRPLPGSPPLVVVGGSAGALDALLTLVAGLPPDFAAALLVVVHLTPDQPSVLPELLSRAGPLPAQAVRGGEAMLPGQIYVAPPDHHLLAGPATLSLSRGPRENRSRPSIDVLFRSAALHHGARVAAVVLSGLQDDGTAGLWAVKQRGGCATVQRPEDAAYPDMPLSALRQVEVDDILPAAEMAASLAAWAISAQTRRVDEAEGSPHPGFLSAEVDIAGGEHPLRAGLLAEGRPSPWTCPACHGSLIQLTDGPITRFRCHTGHAYSALTLLDEVRRTVDDALWSAARALDEQMLLLAHLGDRLQAASPPGVAGRLDEEARTAADRLRTVRDLALQLGSPAPPLP